MILVVLAVVFAEWAGIDRRARVARARGADRLATMPDRPKPFRVVL